MAIIEIARIQVRRGKELQTGVPQLEPGEFGWAQDTENLYIGKRITEGANSNQNTRILTELDLGNIFSLLKAVNTTTIVTPYFYRTGTNYLYSLAFPPQRRIIQDKLDETVSLEDFGVKPSFTATNISTEFQAAVNAIFFNSTWNSFSREDARRKLRIPPGRYYINNAIELPPYTTLEGSGPELTILTLISTTTNIFRTVDADGNTYESGLMESGLKRSRNISIKGMSLEYDPTKSSNNPLVRVDNVLDFSIENCILRTAFTATSTSTFGLVNAGIGIGIQGQGGGVGSGDVNLCENIQINNCKFDSLYIGVRATGTVIRPILTDSIVSNVNRGVEFYSMGGTPGPSNGIIKNNRFENIVSESIFIGANPDNFYRSNHLSENNFFIQAGNGLGLSDNITSSTNSSPIIRFNSSGNKSLNDYFHRRTVANRTTSTAFYYAPLVLGSAFVDTVELMTATIAASSSTTVVKIPLTNENQFVTLRYQMYNNDLSRKGEIALNVAPDGYTALTDSYTYIENITEGSSSPEIYFDVNDSYKLTKNYLNLICVNSATNLTVEYVIHTIV